MCLFAATAQDIIVKIDGDTMKVYDLKVNAKFITYRESPGKESPSRRIGKAKVLSVKKGNGKSITISKPVPAPEITPDTVWQSPKVNVGNPSREEQKSRREKQKGEIKRAVASDNAQLVDAYNKNHSGYGDKKEISSKAGCAVAIMGVTTGSVLANEDVTVEILKCDGTLQYNIFVRNNSDKIIYLDLEKSFRVYDDGTFKPYCSGKQIRQTKNNNSKISISTKKASSSLQYTYRNKRSSNGAFISIEDRTQTTEIVRELKILAIPPMGKVALPPHVSLGEQDEIIKEYDAFPVTLSAAQYSLNSWQVANVDEQLTPYKNTFIITYSPNKNFDTYSTVNFGLYLRQLIGLGTKISCFDETLIHGYDSYTVCGEVYFE